jgi:hypothetical protein
MLNAHPNMVIGPETGLFCGSDLPHLARSMRIDFDVLREMYRRSSCLGEFVEHIITLQLERSGKPRWGDKSPCNIRELVRLFHFFPNAHVLHVIRDGRDVVCSLRDHPKFRWENGVRTPTNVCNPWTECVARWVADTSAGLRWRGDPRYCEVRYEHLVNEPERVLRQVLEWLGEPWDAAVLSYYQSHEEQGYDAPNPGITQPVYQRARDRWRTELPLDATHSFTEEALALLVKLGYAQDHSWAREHAELANASASESTRLEMGLHFRGAS